MKKIIFAFVILAAAFGDLRAVEQKVKPLGVVTGLSGKVTLYTAQNVKGAGIKLGQTLQTGDRLLTGANGRLMLVLSDGTQLKVNYNTDITLRDKDSKGRLSERGVGSIKIALGNLWAKVTSKKSKLEFDTPAAIAAVKGTEPNIEVSESGDLCVKLKEGKLDVANDLGSASLKALQMVCVTKGSAPGKVVVWDGKVEWVNQVGQATKAQVEMLLRDKDGKEKTVILDYEKQ